MDMAALQHPPFSYTVLKTIQLSWDKTLLNISSAPILQRGADIKIDWVFQNTRYKVIKGVPEYQILRCKGCSRIPDLKMYRVFQNTRYKVIKGVPEYQI